MTCSDVGDLQRRATGLDALGRMPVLIFSRVNPLTHRLFELLVPHGCEQGRQDPGAVPRGQRVALRGSRSREPRRPRDGLCFPVRWPVFFVPPKTLLCWAPRVDCAAPKPGSTPVARKLGLLVSENRPGIIGRFRAQGILTTKFFLRVRVPVCAVRSTARSSV